MTEFALAETSVRTDGGKAKPPLSPQVNFKWDGLCGVLLLGQIHKLETFARYDNRGEVSNGFPASGWRSSSPFAAGEFQ